LEPPLPPTDSGQPVVRVTGVGKFYPDVEDPGARLRRMLRGDGVEHARGSWALRDVSLAVGPGEAVGIIGRNGSGKSTLLQVVAGTLDPTEGQVQTSGRSAALLDLGPGFHPEFTGRQNVFLAAAAAGHPRPEVDAQLAHIVAFAEAAEYLDRPVKTYSSGMLLRLAFALHVHFPADLLILDEALGVGDVFFQRKCFEHIRRRKEAGTGILYVSHDLSSVQALCDRVLVLEGGRGVFEGGPREAVNRYYRVRGQALGLGPAAEAPLSAAGTGGGAARSQAILRASFLPPLAVTAPSPPLELAGARLLDEAGRDGLAADMMATVVLDVVLRAHRGVPTPLAGLHLRDRLGHLVFATGTRQLHHELPSLDPGQLLVVSFRIELRVSPGQYTVDLVAGEPAAGDDPNVGVYHDVREGLGPLSVRPPDGVLLPFYGVAQLPVELSHDLEARA
jgi:lipopolysaccharide transport system ATP-binding protein